MASAIIEGLNKRKEAAPPEGFPAVYSNCFVTCSCPQNDLGIVVPTTYNEYPEGARYLANNSKYVSSTSLENIHKIMIRSGFRGAP